MGLRGGALSFVEAGPWARTLSAVPDKRNPIEVVAMVTLDRAGGMGRHVAS
jgi:hypothetical protein